jgi:hypothetical protein
MHFTVITFCWIMKAVGHVCIYVSLLLYEKSQYFSVHCLTL